MPVRRFLMALVACFVAGPALAELPATWPDAASDDAVLIEPVALASSTPFTIADVGDPDDAPPTEAAAALFMPADASADNPVPAVVLLHGAAGVLQTREPAYARQLASLGVAAMVVDVFGARRDLATGFTDRLLNITEAAMLADAYAALAYLDSLPEVDGSKVVLAGFSYGGMAATYAAYEAVAERLAPDGQRFAGHVAFYAPCIASFEDNRATGAPLLMLAGTGDAIVDPERCSAVASELEDGGTDVTTVYYDGAYHQWDGRFAGPRAIGRNLAPCDFYVDDDGDVYDAGSWLPMSGPFMRKIILGLCSDPDGYLIGRDDEIRDRAIVDWTRFLNAVFDG
ncbi:MAG: dienelactone hydrolase family protein [Pseudomonadota bacterium]